jgi:hypothetical protein
MNGIYADLLGAIHLDPWGDQAACIGKAAVLEDPERVTEAKTLCLGNRLTGRPRCPVIDDCNAWVMPLNRNDPGGVRAGKTEDERRSERRRQAQPTVVTVTEKWCPTCEDTKPAEAFNRNRSHTSGLGTECRVCAYARYATRRTERAAG